MPTFDFPPLLWWGLPLAAVPLAIHLLNRLRHRRVPFAALEFLLASQKRYRTQVLLRQLLLLALRTAAVLGLVFALAQPRWTSGLGGLLGGGRTFHLVLLDDSGSMGDRGTAGSATTAFDRGRAAIARLAADLAATPGQEIAVGRFSTITAATGDLAKRFDIERQPATPQAAARAEREFAAGGPSARGTAPTAAILAVEPLLAPAAATRQVLWIASDFRAHDWKECDEARAALRRLAAAGVALRFVQCGPRVAAAREANLSVAGLDIVGGVPAAGALVTCEVTVRNDGNAPVRDVPVSLREDGVVRPGLQLTEIPPGGTATARFDARFATPGGHVIEAVLPADRLPLDDARTAVVDVAERVEVLLVDGDPRGGGTAGDAFYVATALAPGGRAATGIEPRIEPRGRLAEIDLATFHSVWLLDVEALEPAEVEAVEAYARNGGGVVFFTGPRTRADVVNRTLYRGGNGLFPVPLAGPVELPAAAGGSTAPDIVAEDHPVVAVLAGQRNPLLDAVRVERVLAVDRDHQPPPAAGLRRLLSLRTAAPLIVERPFGAGLAVAVLSTAAPTWNNWARGNPSWVVVMLELEGHVARARRRMASLDVGDPIRVPVDPAVDETAVEFSLPPDGAAVVEAAVPTDTGLEARLATTAVPGAYVARWQRLDGTPQERFTAVTVDPREGMLAAAGDDRLRAALDGVPFDIETADALDAGAGSTGGRPLVKQALMALIGVLLLEQLTALRAGYHMPAAGPRRRGGRRP